MTFENLVTQVFRNVSTASGRKERKKWKEEGSKGKEERKEEGRKEGWREAGREAGKEGVHILITPGSLCQSIPSPLTEACTISLIEESQQQCNSTLPTWPTEPGLGPIQTGLSHASSLWNLERELRNSRELMAGSYNFGAAILEWPSFIMCLEKLREAILQRGREMKPKGKGEQRWESLWERRKREIKQLPQIRIPGSCPTPCLKFHQPPFYILLLWGARYYLHSGETRQTPP